ncbi:MAG: hypothetical protein ACE362_18080 [Phaeodactylibacter xiamenensis]|uniref:Phage tail collar domain-containing protein n=1 Tax=Phaeodactylibacter xiamenensis TaxID=1524460 RepID=A0A098S7U9_9BACT|nr:hypothetical protein [Phaeodactylibacter xiamenensis]KGE88649.1 hypothetical protein IX84_08250 [Phaeodactylibacter xiamenensis]MCR9053448.1 hypothetical protein [bacterium]
MKEILTLFFVTLTLSLSAQFHPMLDAQGVLKDADGFPVEDGPQELTFRLYPDAVSNDALWSETVTLQISGGAYQHYLGSLTPIDQRIFENTVYLGVSVEGVELTPRSTFTVTPYAIALTGCTGAVGDVKMSVLNPEEFTAENGACWELMSGQALPAESKLAGLTNWQNLPDVRGRFLRSFDSRGVDGNDSDRGNNPQAGTYQNSVFKRHNHNLALDGQVNDGDFNGSFDVTDGPRVYNLFSTSIATSGSTNAFSTTSLHAIRGGNYGCGAGGMHFVLIPMSNAEGNTFNILSHTHDIGMSGGTETRPKNINLYIYMRTR